jgi:DNA modification methylase
MHRLYYGDNLKVLKQHFENNSVDLIYLDPPFKSGQSYNVLFRELDGSSSQAQLKAFEDTWTWDENAIETYQRTVEQGGKVAQALLAFHAFMGGSEPLHGNNMMAYVAMMAPRLVEMRRVLKPTGSIYLHCDPAASHYLKLLMDAVFDPRNFRNEIIWKRTHSHGNVGRNYGSINDNIMFYTKSDEYAWNKQYLPFTEEYIKEKFRYKDPDGRVWQSVTLRNPGPRPNLRYPYKANNGQTYQPHPNGWSCNQIRMKQYDDENRLHFPSKEGGQLRLKMYRGEMKGIQMQNIWDDIYAINSQAKERLGYQTQKPEALLERIIQASSNEGDIVLDPFCGCGTTIAAAQKLNRQWIGIDITQTAIVVIKNRLKTEFLDRSKYEVIGEPEALADAEALARSAPYQFQWWSLGLVGARPAEGKKGSDKGIDGRLYFHDDPKGKTKQIILSVKSGKLEPSHIRDLVGVVDRERAQIGVLISFNSPTQSMRAEAAEAGFYESPNGRKYRRIQLLTIAQLLEGAKVDYPFENVTFKRAPRAKAGAPEHPSLPFRDPRDA